VALPKGVVVKEQEGQPAPTLVIDHEPIQVTGREYGLVRFVAPVNAPGDIAVDDVTNRIVDSEKTPEYFRVIHFNKITQQFDGPEEVVSMHQVIADENGTLPFTNRGIEQSPLNEMGWYIYGALNHAGRFVVQAIAPRALFQLHADRLVMGRKPIKTYLKQESWANLAAEKGRISSVVMSRSDVSLTQATDWQEGDRALLVHVYGGIGGKQMEPAAKGLVYFGHFAFGVATVVREPLSDELRFDIVYHQIYTHNGDGLTAGTMHWCRYMGDRQFGWIGIRPTADTLIQFAPFMGNYEDADGTLRSPLNTLVRQLEVMAARYRIGDGSGGTYVGSANNCSQDSNQSLYAALRFMQRSTHTDENIGLWMEQHPATAARLEQLKRLGKELKWHLMPFGSARADWEEDQQSLGSTLEDYPLKTLLRGLVSWRTMFPRIASDSITEAFLREGAIAWMLRTNQLGGDNPNIEPLAPMTF
jgi:predicted Abi (CAAX) family protease